MIIMMKIKILIIINEIKIINEIEKIKVNTLFG